MSRTASHLIPTIALASLALSLPAASAENGVASSDAGRNVNWPTYAGDLAGSKHQPLDQINAANFSDLEVVWRFKTDNIGNRPEFKLEGTPLVVDGVAYATAGSRRGVIALDATTGRMTKHARNWEDCHGEIAAR